MTEPEYTYRIPRSFRVRYTVLFYTPLLLFAVAIGVYHSWIMAIGAALLFLLQALGGLWLWSKAIIVIDSERIRWPLKRSELRWDDVQTSTIMIVLGTEYARVETKRGKVRRIVLNRIGGDEYRARVLAKLGLA
ncbi:MAG: hypothetical protein OES69_13545 [Myxococcales bacterium]|nr:hypothetical protein [Myxococcales bacterium]MDH3844961.1 hypothetical protein [Myxococcales bacterium]